MKSEKTHDIVNLIMGFFFGKRNDHISGKHVIYPHIAPFSLRVHQILFHKYYIHWPFGHSFGITPIFSYLFSILLINRLFGGTYREWWNGLISGSTCTIERTGMFKNKLWWNWKKHMVIQLLILLIHFVFSSIYYHSQCIHVT